MKVSARLLESVDRNYHHKDQFKEHCTDKIRDLVSQEFDLDTSQFEIRIRTEIIETKVHMMQARISQKVILLEEQKLSQEIRQRLFELFVLAEEVLMCENLSQREEKKLQEQLKRIDIHESAFRALISRFKLESILDYYIQGNNRDFQTTESTTVPKNEQSQQPRERSLEKFTDKERTSPESESDDSVNSSELHLDLDSILKPGSFIGSQLLHQVSEFDEDQSTELKSDLRIIASKLNALVNKLNSRTSSVHKQREEKSSNLNFGGFQG